MQSQIEAEVSGVLDMLKTVYGIFGFTFELQLSTRPEKYLGEISQWDAAESALSHTLNKEFGGDGWSVNPGDGAFYGPKIDIKLTDALKRKHQCATIQLDFQLPERFQLEYKKEGDGFDRPVMIHRAILGSVERMIAVLCEHTAGKWPFWLSPRQCMVLPAKPESNEYAQHVYDIIHSAGYYVDIDISNALVNTKILGIQPYQYNMIIIVGPKEQDNQTVMIRHRDRKLDADMFDKEKLKNMSEQEKKLLNQQKLQVQDEMKLNEIVDYFHGLKSNYQ